MRDSPGAVGLREGGDARGALGLGVTTLPLLSSPQDPRLYLVFPHDSSALSSSFHHLQLFDQDSSNVVSVSVPLTSLAPVGREGQTVLGEEGWGAAVSTLLALSAALSPGPLLHHL